MSRLVDLTMTLREGLMTFPVHLHPTVEISQLSRLEVEGRETRKLVLVTHTGTHLDAPRHFVPGGATIENMSLDTACGPATVLRFCRKFRTKPNSLDPDCRFRTTSVPMSVSRAEACSGTIWASFQWRLHSLEQ